MNSNQMEFALKTKHTRLASGSRQRRQQRAQFWFAHIRRVVANSTEWKPDKSSEQAA